MGGCRVRVPASSANLGPGFDSFAAALSLHLEVEVRPAGEFSLETDLDLPRDRSNLIVRSFERFHPADRLSFRVRSEIPLSGGLGSSAAAIVAGLLAGRACSGTAADVFGLACELEGHPDNVSAALHGGFVICADGQADRFDPPAGLDAVLVVPDEPVRTAAARAALPSEVPLGDAVFNTAHGALLVLGLTRGSWELVGRGLADRVHQPQRAHLFPRSYALLGEAESIGAIGATISGAGPTVLFWCLAPDTAGVVAALTDRAAGWASVLQVGFESSGASVVSV
ncbi:MAG TPA: homoserine kinase [Solirubrobacteraceae bacterium]|jgi:homoserine kinase|nr:homoserine kinase [Solirubrobacteraceae bacterium]